MTARDIINPSIEPKRGPYAALGDRFRASRLRLGLTLRAAAQLLDMTMTRLSEIERGDTPPTIHDLWALLDWATENTNPLPEIPRVHKPLEQVSNETCIENIKTLDRMPPIQVARDVGGAGPYHGAATAHRGQGQPDGSRRLDCRTPSMCSAMRGCGHWCGAVQHAQHVHCRTRHTERAGKDHQGD